MGLLTGEALWPLAVATAVFLLLVDLMHRRVRWAARYPPGPRPLPGLGHLLHVDFQDMLRSVNQMGDGRSLIIEDVTPGPRGQIESLPRSLLTAQVSCKVRALRPASLANTLRLQLRSRFGDVFSLQLAWTPVVVINGLAAVREALVHRSEDTADRPPAPIYEHLGFGPRAQGKRRTGQAAAPRGQGQR
ncbi:hypothetical protein QTO34_018095 [Cnephaeus nilssonii]|uniref:Uncharacterized protein n=1 Tax=Cnephaeus nilssonii TaxID=3371016 RepID=A0AA40I279_CNENI|nr:hypothetical protein QTO34_018095 [Eptesicus nilssonii]